MKEQVYDQKTPAADVSTEQPKPAPKKKLTYQEFLEKRKRRERRENAAMIKLFFTALVVVSLIIIVSLLSKYF